MISAVLGTVLGTVEGRATNLVFFTASVFFSFDTTVGEATGGVSLSLGVFLQFHLVNIDTIYGPLLLIAFRYVGLGVLILVYGLALLKYNDLGPLRKITACKTESTYLIDTLTMVESAFCLQDLSV